MKVYRSKYPEPMPADKYGKWTVLGTRQKIHGRAMYYCVCECGNVAFVERNNLVRGKSNGCGCCNHKTMPLAPMPHGIHKTRIFHIFKGMMDRCYLTTCKQYGRYGGRGITICDEWRNDTMAFYNWAITHGYSDDLSIDRIDNNKGYSPDNCRWATAEEQMNNRSVSRKLTFNGKTQSVTQWAREIGINKSTLFHRLEKMSTEKALTMPLMKSKSNIYRKEVTNNG